ncbi:MAG: KTSC domain-containing protein [Bacteroidia bacterium]|nr:KTSC domain-containing protein [Bacteroidia bacterium]
MSELLKHNVIGSSNIEEIKFNPDTNELDVKFVKGKWYRYFGVGRETYDNFIAAPSVGGFFAQHIKGIYRYQAI